jgi:hypothetical protein
MRLLPRFVIRYCARRVIGELFTEISRLKLERDRIEQDVTIAKFRLAQARIEHAQVKNSSDFERLFWAYQNSFDRHSVEQLRDELLQRAQILEEQNVASGVPSAKLVRSA